MHRHVLSMPWLEDSAISFPFASVAEKPYAKKYAPGEIVLIVVNGNAQPAKVLKVVEGEETIHITFGEPD